ncbi:MAG: 16S rRNA (cytidine(1402)-2'-O)-methyltransferase [Gammaproteobacteria bacterium]
MHAPILQLIAAPIGNLADISLRALDALRAADIIAAEDTRVARRLLSAHDIRGKKLLSARAQNEEAAAQQIIKAMLHGGHQNAAYLSDAGTPGISDPGARIAKRARAAGIVVSAIPGASALTALLCVAGCRGGAVHFLGFAPRAKDKRRKFFLDIAALSGDIVLFESPRRVFDACQLLAGSFGDDARVVVGRELSKAHEQIVDAKAADIVRAFAEGEIPQLGEFAVYAESPAMTKGAQTPASVFDTLVRELPPRRAAALAAKITGANANDIYRKHANKQGGE